MLAKEHLLVEERFPWRLSLIVWVFTELHIERKFFYTNTYNHLKFNLTLIEYFGDGLCCDKK